MGHMTKSLVVGAFAALLAVGVAAAAESHRFLGVFLNDNMLRVVDLDTISNSGAYKRAQSTSIYYERQQLGSSGQFFVFLQTVDEIDCATSRSRTVSGAAFDENLSTVQASDIDGPWKTMAPDSAGEAVVKSVCGQTPMKDDDMLTTDLLTLRGAMLKARSK